MKILPLIISNTLSGVGMFSRLGTSSLYLYNFGMFSHWYFLQNIESIVREFSNVYFGNELSTKITLYLSLAALKSEHTPLRPES